MDIYPIFDYSDLSSSFHISQYSDLPSFSVFALFLPGISANILENLNLIYLKCDMNNLQKYSININLLILKSKIFTISTTFPCASTTTSTFRTSTIPFTTSTFPKNTDFNFLCYAYDLIYILAWISIWAYTA